MSGNPPSILTAQYDNCRDGYNPAETILSPSNASLTQASFSPLKVDTGVGVVPSGGPSNPIYAQPLYVAGTSVVNNGTTNYNACGASCNMLIAVTLNDTVFAWNADTGAVLWSIRAGNPGSPKWVTQQPLSQDCGTKTGTPVSNQYANLPFAGILSTPVIDTSGSTPYMFLVSECTNGSQGNFQFFLHKIDLTQGVDAQSAVPISATSAGINDPDDWVSNAVQFTPGWELQRPALLEVTVPENPSYSPLIYIAFGVGIQETTQPYQGWVFGYSTSLVQQFAFVSDPTGNTSGLTPPCSTGCTACSTNKSTCCTLGPGCSPNNPNQCCPTTCVPLQTPTSYFQNSPSWCGHGGGIWMSGRGPAASTVSTTSYAFLGVGNGGFNGTTNAQGQFVAQNYGESILGFQQVGTAVNGQPAKFFAPYGNTGNTGATILAPSLSGGSCPNEGGAGACQYSVEIYNENDWDAAGSGVLIFKDNSKGYIQLVTVDKAGYGHLLSQGAGWQGFAPGDPDDQFPFGAAQTLCTGTAADCDRVTSLGFDTSAEVLYYWPNGEKLTALQFAPLSPVSGPGTISYSSGTTVYPGAGANFLATFIAGDTITANGQSEVVNQVASDGTSLTVINPFTPALSNASYTYQGYFTKPEFDPNSPGGGYPGGSVVVTSNSGANELVWALVPQPGSSQVKRSQGVLYAYNNYANGLNAIWNSAGIASFCDSAFALPTVVNGSAYIPTYAIVTAATCGLSASNPAESGVIVLCGQGASACNH